MDFNELLANLGERLGIEDLRANDDGVCALSVDETEVYLYSLPEERAVFMRTVIGERPTVGAEAFYAAMLRGNHCFAGTGGATLALDDETDRLVLNRYDRIETMSVDEFADTVERFANAASLWAKLLNANESDEAGAEAPEGLPQEAGEAGAEPSGLSFFSNQFLRI